MIQRNRFSPLPRVRFIQGPVGSRPILAGLLISLTVWACGGEESTGPDLATQLAFFIQPSAWVGNLPIFTAVGVAIQDQSGTRVTNATSAVTVAIGTNAAAGTLSGTTTVNAVLGVAIFSDLSIDLPGSGYTLVASSGNLTNATSEMFGVVPPTFAVVGHGNLTEQGTSDLWVHGTVAYTGTIDLFHTGIVANTMWVWDVSNPATPVRAASVVVDGVSSVPDVKIRADGTLGVITHQFSVLGSHGITLLDLSDPLRPQVITRFTLSLGGVHGVHNAWIEGDYVYAVWNGRIFIIDVSNPADPQSVGRLYPGSSPNVHDVNVRDGLAFVSHLDDGLVILDVGNGIAGGTPTNPGEVSRILTVGGRTHSAWYWPDAGYVFVSEESERPGVVHVVDVSDLFNPVEVATFGVSEHTAHNFWMDEARGGTRPTRNHSPRRLGNPSACVICVPVLR